MKKRTKFRLRNDLAVPFWISISICLLCAGINFLLFYNSFFRALTKLNEEPIATITFKYKTAQRKFLERVVWDRLKQNSPVYNGDTIHTADLSEATVWFDDGTTLELAENTMAQVFRHDDGSLGADLSEGNATVDSSEGGNGLTLTAANIKVTVQKGTKISASKADSDENVALTVQKGQATLADGVDFKAGETFSVDENGGTKSVLSVITPLPQEKILYFSEELCEVNFEWKNSETSDSLELEVASDKVFSKIVQSRDVTNLSETTLSLPKGTYYWKLTSLTNGNRTESREGKIQIVQSLKPNLLVPAKNYSYSYRKQTPSVRFIWSECDAATAYNFAVSKNADMSNPVIEQRSSSSSIIISTLPAGTYYYQVTPYYVLNRTGLANPSETGTFKIEQKNELYAPVLVSPISGEFIDKTKKTARLSWQMDDEPMTYKVLVSSDENLSKPVISHETNENFISLSSSELKKLNDGEYFWSVTQTDSEGNESAKAVTRRFYAINGEIEQRTVFPPDNYEVWLPLLSDTRFTWKTNLSFMQYLQIAADRDFNQIIFDSETNGTSFSGAGLDIGEYYWRITTKEENFKRATPAKKLCVVGELDFPKIEYPANSRKAVVRPTEPCTFAWEEEKGADYYRVKLYRQDGETPLYDENFISGTSVDIDVEKFPEGNYRWEIQSYAYETALSSRRSSLLSRANFTLRKIRPVTLTSPQNGKVYGGWEAIENPTELQWASSENYSKAQLILTKKNGIEPEEKIFDQNSYKQVFQQLSSGDYEWTVKAFTVDELDISATQSFTFKVEEIPPFAAPKNASTEGGSLFNADYLKKTPYIVFYWEKVNRADSYILEIFKNGKVIHKQIISDVNITKFKFEDLQKLLKGDFTWKLRAVRMTNDKKEVLIDGNPAEGMFTIDYTLNANGGKHKNTGALYGQ